MYILGIDLGTSSLKGLVMDRNGTIQGAASKDYPLLQPEAGFSEQDPKDWIQACGQVIEELAEMAVIKLPSKVTVTVTSPSS